ncbi:MAG: YkgJ family cysteine cluster protein [Phycisphaerales bacterium]|nr:YkgJ family cysteine cluster protein [Phycisphaerales bacterium]
MSGHVSIPVELTVYGGTLRASIPVPAGPVTATELLPVFRAVAEAVIHLSVKNAERQGRTVSCRDGCAACCRQFVPVAESEARFLISLVEGMPPARRAELKRRFAEAARRLDDAGLRDRLMAPETQPRDALKTLGLDYFRVGLDCPFLENKSCSIHPDRPLVCREYLVTSPARACDDLHGVEGVDLPLRPSLALCRIDEQPSQTLVKTVPLAMIFEWAKSAGACPAPRPGPAIFDEFLRRLGPHRQAPPDASAPGTSPDPA